jgi:hypothetical protein
VSVAAVLANATWFSATAIVPTLERRWGLHASGAAWLVIAVQLGFITGSIGAALLNLPDRLEPRRRPEIDGYPRDQLDWKVQL